VTPSELLERLRVQAIEAERIGATAPVAAVLRAVAEDVEALNGLAPSPAPDRLLTLNEAAQRLSVPVRWFSEAQPDGERLPFLRHLTRKTVRVSEHALGRWLETRQP